MRLCFHCNKALNLTGNPGRGEVCPFCSSDLKVCLNCRFYDKTAYNECAEPSAERVVIKDRANFCEFFEFRESKEGQKNAPPEDPLEKLKDLFRS